jgi:hypothetical protein
MTPTNTAKPLKPSAWPKVGALGYWALTNERHAAGRSVSGTSRRARNIPGLPDSDGAIWRIRDE